VSKALDDIAVERLRQIDVEGWTSTHDDQHSRGELAMAAACYATPEPVYPIRANAPFGWPWDVSWWKPKSHNPRTRQRDHTDTGRRRDLVKAGALIVAEIERLDRKTP
jgi:hypothetical protein